MKYSLTLLVLLVLGSACQLLDPDGPGTIVPPTADEDSTIPYLDVNGTRLHVETFGDSDNDVLIFLHGGPGGCYAPDIQVTNLADTFFVVMFDQRGGGLSRRHDPDAFSIAKLIGDLDGIINHYTTNVTQKVHLVGHSWGGQYATFYINEHPDRVDKAVLSDPGPFTSEIYESMEIFDTSPHESWLNEMFWLNEVFSPDDHARLDFSIMNTSAGMSAYHYNEDNPYPIGRRGFVALHAIQDSGLDENGNLVFNFAENVDQYTNEVLFIRSGWNDIYTPEYISNEMTFYPNARMMTIEDVGHDMDWIKWEEYCAAVRDFITNG